MMPNPLAAFGAAPPQTDQPAGGTSQPAGKEKNPLNAFGNRTAAQPQAAQNETVDFSAPEVKPQLPEGAIDWTPGGEPYFGEGIQAILKQWKYNYFKDTKPVDQTDWQELKARWDASLKQMRSVDVTKNTPEAAAINREQASVIGETIQTAYRQAQAQGSVLSPVLKGLSASVTAIGDLFSIPARKLEQGVGAMEAVRETANEVQSPLPRIGDNDFTKWMEGMWFGAAYDVARLALSPSDNKWDYAQQKIEEGWTAGRIQYSQAFDATLKEKYLQAYRQGEDPGLLALKLQNPYAELGGQVLLDPLNLVGAFAKGAKTARELEAAHAAVAETDLLKIDKAAQAFKDITSAQDDATAIRALGTLQEARAQQVIGMESSSKLLNARYGIGDLTTSSRTNALVGKGKELLGNMALVLREAGMSYDGIGEAIVYGAKSVSRDAEEMKAGLAGLAHLPNANMWLSNDYAESFNVIYKLLRDENGTLNGAKLSGLMKVSDPAQFAEEAAKLMKAATLQALPDVNELEQAARLAKEATKTGGEISARTRAMAEQYARLPEHVKYLNRVDQTLSKYIKNPINRVLSPLYFNLQGGVAVKNWFANNELILIDKGIGAWFKDGRYWSVESQLNELQDIFGTVPESAQGFKSLVAASTGKEPFLFGKLMESGERSGAARVVWASVRDTFKKMIPAAFPSLSKDVEAGTITQKQADKLLQLLIKHNGNFARAEADFRDLYKVGSVEAWRHLDFVTDFERSGLEGMGYWREIEDLAQTGAASADDVEKVFAKLLDSIANRSKEAVKDVVGLSQDHPSAETWADLMKAVEEGHLNPADQQVFTAIMESAEQARMEYQTLLDQAAQKAMGELAQQGRLEEMQHIGDEMNRVRETLRKAGPVTARDTHKLTQDAWRWTEAIKGEKKPDIAILKDYWTKAGLRGDPPLDLTKQSLLKEIWKQRFENVTELWNSSLDAVVGESETVVRQMEAVIDTTELNDMAKTARSVTAQAQAFRSAVFENGALKIRPVQDVNYIARQYGVTSEEILQAINNKLPAGTQAYEKIQDVPTGQLLDVLEQARIEKGLPEVPGIAVPPPHALGSQPSLPRAWNESAKGASFVLDNIKQRILERWGQTDAGMQASPALDEMLRRVAAEFNPKMAEIRPTALRVAERQREFTLLNYGKKTYGDVALSYIMPYHFFYTRSYKNWVSRIATNPEIAAGYGKYKGQLEEINRDLPDWYKQQLNINPLTGLPAAQGKTLLGIPLDHPLYINLEATVNPLYGLTGTDFNDPVKRTNWATATMDDLGKFGPTLWAPVQMAIAAKLYMDGETDAASRWGSRLIPETAQVKAVTSLFGRPVELDPAVQFFSGGIDPYERGRMGYAAAQLIQEGRYSPEQVQEQFQQQEGPAWDEAYQMSIQSRAASSISSYFLGVGFKPRSTNDVAVEQMLTDVNKLYAMSDVMSGEQYKNAWEQLRARYPDGMLDTVLLAKKGGDKRDAAYAYQVLGRLPPGEMSGVFKAIGISQEDVSKFYDSKGFTAPGVSFTPTEKQRFMAAIVDLGAMLKIPDSATRTEWNNARGAYGQATEEIKKQLGDDIWEKVSLYYDLKNDDKERAAQFKAQHPEVQAALQLKGEAVANSPILSAYYGGIDNIEAYVSGRTRQQLEDKYGRDIYDIQQGYFDATNSRAYLAQHPELKRFWADKKVLDKEAEKMFFEFGQRLPQMKGAQFRPDFQPSSGVQQTLYNQLQPQNPVPDWAEISTGMPEWLKNEVTAYAFNNRPVSKRATTELDYLAGQGGFYDAKDLLRTAALSLKVATNGPAVTNSPNPLAAFGQ